MIAAASLAWALANFGALAGVQAAPQAVPIFDADETIEESSGDTSTGNDAPLVIDILVPPPERAPPTDAELRQCEEEIDAATVTGEIIVCRQRGEDPNNYYSGSREDAQRRYAEETAFAGDILAPDVAGAGIFRGPPTVSGLCFIPPCPKDPALIIDVEALPEAPEGSDADRIANGLAPLEDEEGLSAEEIRRTRQAMGLPMSPDENSDE